MEKVYSDCFSFLCEIKELLFMNGMGEGALVVQNLIAETGLQAQENVGCLRLIKQDFHCCSLSQREEREARERRWRQGQAFLLIVEKTLSILEGREEGQIESQRNTARDRDGERQRETETEAL